MIKLDIYEMGSEGYPSFGWNYYAGECLKGHVIGVFGVNTMDVRLGRMYTTSDMEQKTKEILTRDPDLVGLTMPPGSLFNTDKFLKILKNSFGHKKMPLVVLGSQLPTYYAQELLERYGPISNDLAIVMGDGEKPLERLVGYLQGVNTIEEVPNIQFRIKSEFGKIRIIHTPLAELIHPASFDTVPEIISKGYESAMIQSSKACHWGLCSFCTRTSFRNPGIDFSNISPENLVKWEGFDLSRVFSEIESLIELGVKSIEFCDDEFFGGRSDERMERINVFAEAYQELQKEYNVVIPFRFFTRPDVIFRPSDEKGNKRVYQTLNLLRKANASRIFLGIEGGDDDSLKYYNRGISLEIGLEAISITKELGYGLDLGYIMFYPEQTIGGILRMSKFFKDNDFIHSNQWPFRPLAVNKGSYLEHAIYEEGLALETSEEDMNFMRIPWRFRDAKVQKIYASLMEIAGPDKEVMYALKVITKKNYSSSSDVERDFCQQIVEEDALVHLFILEELAKASISSELTENKVAEIATKMYGRIDELIKRVEDAIEDNVVIDRDGTLDKAISSFYGLQRGLVDRQVLRP